jgi:2-hydroxychromene-2-carboxylate isomerase
MKPRAAPQPRRQAVEFFYCCSCPWTYLAFVRLQETALRTGADIVFRPVLAEWIPTAGGRALPYAWLGPDPAMRAYAAKDLRDWARFCSVSVELPPSWPARPQWAQRGAVAAIDAGVIRRYADAVFRAHFSAGRDISDRRVVLEVAAVCGLEGPDFESRLDDEATLAAVRRNTDELVARGGFGSPTMFLGEDMYFGHDRVSLLESALMRSADRPLIAPGEHGR